LTEIITIVKCVILLFAHLQIILSDDVKRHTIGILRWYQFLARCVPMVALERFELEFRSRSA